MNPTNPMAGSVSNPTNATGGVGGGSNTTLPMGGSLTQVMGGAGGIAPVAGSTPLGGDTQGGQAMGGGAGGMDTGPACPKPAGQICHEFIANDNSRNVVNYVDEFTSQNPGGVVWSKNVGHATPSPENSPRTIEIVDNAKATNGKAILVSVNDGYVELDRVTGNKLEDVTTQNTGVTGACRMPDGNTALGTNAAIKIVGPTGAAVRSFNLPAGSNLRAINRNPVTGDFWLSKTETVYQLGDNGQVKWSGFMGTGTKGYAVWWREGGGAYATTGEPATVVQLDATGQIVETVGGRTAFPELALDFFSGFVRLPNGNYVVANWLGHLGNPGANTAEIVEFAPDGMAGKAVWTWGNQSLARQITNVYVFR
jgi:hypothetical protein